MQGFACGKVQRGYVRGRGAKPPCTPSSKRSAKASRAGGLRVPLNPLRDIFRKMMSSGRNVHWKQVYGSKFSCRCEI
jgi:hypothetical protein